MILAGDVGGTKTHLGLFERRGGRLVAHRQVAYSSIEFVSLEAMIAQFLVGERGRVRAAAIGVAGPVVRGRSQVVNVRWPVDAGRLARGLGLARTDVLNDLEATARGIPELGPSRTINLTPRLRSGDGYGALIAAGTGLGMALLSPEAGRFRAVASEGGHQEFGPRDDLEIELLRYARERYGRVSVERLVSGPGFSLIYRFLIESGHSVESVAMARRLGGAEDANAAISGAGLEGDDPTAVKTLKLWVSLYGSAAGDLALVAKATGGVWVGGGIAPKILPALRSGQFVKAFRNKGRLSPLLERIPIRVILEPKTALFGAAALAFERANPRNSPSSKG